MTRNRKFEAVAKLGPAITDYFAGQRRYAYPRAGGIFSNLAWRLLPLNLCSVRHLSDKRMKLRWIEILRDAVVRSRWHLLATGIVGPVLATLLLCTIGSLWPIRLDYRRVSRMVAE